MNVAAHLNSKKKYPQQNIIVFVGTSGDKSQTLVTGGISKELTQELQNYWDQKIFTAKPAEQFFVRNSKSEAGSVLFVGLGAAKKTSHEGLRKACASAYKTLKAQKIKEAVVCVASAEANTKSGEYMAQAMTEGFVLPTYVFADFKTANNKGEYKGPETVSFGCSSKSSLKAAQEGIKVGQIVAESMKFARWLGDNPGNIMTPTRLAEEAKNSASGTKMKVTVWDKARIKKEKMGCFYGVSVGSEQEPKFIIMEYKGAAASKKPICFVGKGLTFDSGGISLKPGASMEEMKYDMCGGAAVIATMSAIAKLKLPINAIAFVPTTENMPGPAATKPGDIHIARNGKTVEVNNTDAEGRLILADALVYACEQKPGAIFDTATLTGAMKMALGDYHTGYFAWDDKICARVEKAAEISGELLWRMPLLEDHVKDMKGNYGDLSNISYNAGAGSAKGAAFLSEFVSKDIPWAHFDIAATAWNCAHRASYNPDKGATGVIVRTFVELARAWK